MNKHLHLAACLGLTAAASWAVAQRPAPVAHLQVPAVVRARAHAQATAVFAITVDAGYHIQSDHPKSIYYIPTAIAITPADGVRVAKVAWPPTVNHPFSFSPAPLPVFEGTVKVPVTLATGDAGSHILHGTFQFQACNDRSCLAPVKMPFTLDLEVK